MKNPVAIQKWIVCILVTVLLAFVLQSVSYGGGKIYWTDAQRNPKIGKIRSANLDGSNLQDVVTELQHPVAIALDMFRRKVYWADEGTRKIQQANLNGRHVRELLTGLGYPWDIALALPGAYSVTPRRDKLTTSWAKVKVQ